METLGVVFLALGMLTGVGIFVGTGFCLMYRLMYGQWPWEELD